VNGSGETLDFYRFSPGSSRVESEKGIAPSVRLLNWLSNPEKIGGKMEITNSKRRGGDSLDLKDPIPQIKGIIL
jgi:hypothetical protein